MKIGIIGLGKMGHNLALNMKDNGIDVVAYSRSPEKVDMVQKEGMQGAYTIGELCESFEEQRVIWLMVPAGEIVDNVISQLEGNLSKGDIIIDGGNSHYRDSVRRYEELAKIGVSFIDIGTSGGMEGARSGACMMIGGDEDAFEKLEEVFWKICVRDGYSYIGRSGSGHYVKMIHNGIEYGMLQAIGEGFEIMQKSDFEIDFEDLSKVWSHGSVIRGWLMELCQRAFEKDPSLDGVQGVIDSSGEGLWTVEEALRLQIPSSVIAQSLFARYYSKDADSFSAKVIASLRNEFGGHSVTKRQG